MRASHISPHDLGLRYQAEAAGATVAPVTEGARTQSRRVTAARHWLSPINVIVLLAIAGILVIGLAVIVGGPELTVAPTAEGAAADFPPPASR
jgi:hypothetical protein